MPRKVVLWLLEIPKTQAQNSSIPAIRDCFTIDITSTPAASTSSITVEGVLGFFLWHSSSHFGDFHNGLPPLALVWPTISVIVLIWTAGIVTVEAGTTHLQLPISFLKLLIFSKRAPPPLASG